MNHRLSHAYYVPEPKAPTRTDKIAENRQAMKAAVARYLSFATGIPGSYELILSLTPDHRKVDSRTISIEEFGTDLIVTDGLVSFPFQCLFHEAADCSFTGQMYSALNELHSFIRRAAKDEIDSVCASMHKATTSVLPIPYFKVGGENGLFHMKDGRYNCVIQQYECDEHTYLKIVSLDKKHALAQAGVAVGTYIQTSIFKADDIAEDLEKVYGKTRTEHMLEFRAFVADRMQSRRKTLPIPDDVKAVKVETPKVPLFTLATKDGELVKPAEPALEIKPPQAKQEVTRRSKKKKVDYPELSQLVYIRTATRGQIRCDGLTILVCRGEGGLANIRLRDVPKEHPMRAIADRSFAVFQDQLMYSDDGGTPAYKGDDLLRYQLRQYVRGLLIAEGVELKAPLPA